MRLTTLRKAGRTDEYHAAAEYLFALLEHRPPFARQAVELEHSQGSAHLNGDLDVARRTVYALVDSPFLVHQGLALVLAGQWALTPAASDETLEAARDSARSGGLDLLQRVSEELLQTAYEDRREVEFFYP